MVYRCTCRKPSNAFYHGGGKPAIIRKNTIGASGQSFAARNFLQYGSIPVGILLGGALADYVFEPFMLGESSFALFLQRLIGNGPGSGMAVMFLCTWLTGFLFSLAIYLLLRRLKTENRL